MDNGLKGTFAVTMVLPAWTVENDLILEPSEGGELKGRLDTKNGDNPMVEFTRGRWNKEYFSIELSVGPGQLLLTGKVTGDALEGVVIIEDTPDSLTGKRIS